MDRQIVYAGSIPLDTDLLNVQRNVQMAIGALAHAILGDTPVFDGLTCLPGAAGTVPGTTTVTVGPGSLAILTADDFTAFGALAADTTPVVRSALLTQTQTLAVPLPQTQGQVICSLIQAQFADQDTGQVLLPYWNASNPAVPYSGPGNSGVAQATQRLFRVVLQVKAGAPQTPPAVPPQPDGGWYGLYGVTTYYGRAVPQPGDIAPFPTVSRLRYPLPLLPPAYTTQQAWQTASSWTAPSGVTWARVRLVGGGGGGGGGDTSYSGGGGGAGGYAEAIIQVTPGRAYDVSPGIGGIGQGPLQSGSSGGNSDFGGIVIASGGLGGASHNPDSHGGNPGAGSAGSILLQGGFGGDGTYAQGIPGGNGGASAFGGGGRGADEGGLAAVGTAPGSGGGGAYGASSTGGNGAPGIVILEY